MTSTWPSVALPAPIPMVGMVRISLIRAANSAGTISCTEVVLPGQPTYGYARNGTPLDISADYAYINTLPNRYTEGTATGANQLLRIPQSVFTRGSGYLVNNGGGYAIGATSIAVDTGTGMIEAP